MAEPAGTPAEAELTKKRKQKAKEEKEREAELAAQLPRPVGYRLLIAIPDQEKAFAGSMIQKSDTSLMHDQILTMIGLVLDVGNLAYKDERRFPDGEAWCKAGDYVMFRSNTGTRFKIGKKEFRIMNDDAIDGVVPKPGVANITRAA